MFGTKYEVQLTFSGPPRKVQPYITVQFRITLKDPDRGESAKRGLYGNTEIKF
jgi:hypothetical protein